MDSINVNWGVNVSTGNEKITLEELEVESMEEWNALSKDEQTDKLQSALDDLPERTCIIVEDWS